MFKDIIKLSRKLMILAVLSGSLVFVLSMSSTFVQAKGVCCSECADAEPGCEHVCNFLPNSPGCAMCQAYLEDCWASCNPDPECTH